MTIFYTGKGDNGKTGTLSGKRVEKSSAVMDAIGDIDELNSSVGIAISSCRHKRLVEMLKDIQNDLFIISAQIASFGSQSGIKGLGSIDDKSVKKLADYMDEIGKEVPELKEFVMPGGAEPAAYLHYARAIARRAERSVIRVSDEANVSDSVRSYMNRLSSFLFVAALYANAKERRGEEHPWY